VHRMNPQKSLPSWPALFALPFIHADFLSGS
jgi:hypothetical protein